MRIDALAGSQLWIGVNSAMSQKKLDRLLHFHNLLALHKSRMLFLSILSIQNPPAAHQENIPILQWCRGQVYGRFPKLYNHLGPSLPSDRILSNEYQNF